MVNPNAKLLLHWSCTAGDPGDLFEKRGVTVISNRESPSPEQAAAGWGWGLSLFTQERQGDPPGRPLLELGDLL